ncbi:MAG: AMP-binding protein [Parasporobacterium sp.]|nr:AMP-binding protein [Parasporobacterium sp.]
MSEITAKAPWKPFLGDLPFTMEYPEISMYEGIKAAAEKYPMNVAFDFMGIPTTYKKMLSEIQRCAKSLKTLGVREGDKVTIALPNCPQAIYAFYALNCIGAIANMVHPLSAEKELEFYINESDSITVITLDQFYNKFEAIRQNTKLVNVVLASIKDELSKPLRAGYMLTEGRKIQKIPKDAPVIRWGEFMNIGRACFWNYETKMQPDDTAVILYSGGTTGISKGIELTNMNFNALATQICGVNPMFHAGDKMLAAMPVFHGFGLGVCIHSMLFNGGRCILVPRFTAASYAKLITKYKCNFIAGVPTLYEALLRLPSMEKADLSCLKGVFSGGDSLSIELKKKFDKFLYDHKAVIQVREGYGTTETVTACCLTPPAMHKEGSIGIPFPDTYIKIVKPDTAEELPFGEEGEILLAGPTVMKCYMKHEEETAQTLRTHEDGLTWVYTGDLGYMDEEGFVYFKGRAKRMIISSGYNIYPAQMENVLDANKMVSMSCVIGVPDSYKMQKVKAFVVLNPGYPKNEETWLKLMAYCKKNFAKYAMPYDIEFRDELPKSLVGKVAYRQLEEEELAKIAAAKEKGEDIVADAAAVNKERINAMAAEMEAE